MAVAYYDHLIRISIIGDSTVGKSALLANYVGEDFNPNFMSTVGIDFRVKIIQLGEKTIKLQIWDTAGQEQFRTITTSYYRTAAATLLVYAIDDITSFDHVESWIQDFKAHSAPDVPIILIGNKCDLTERMVSYEKGKALADKLSIPFFETSALDSTNVSESFTVLIDQLLQRIKIVESTVTPIKLTKSRSMFYFFSHWLDYLYYSYK